MKTSLINAVLSQIEGNNVDIDTADKDTIQTAIDAGNHGADGGYSGFIWHDELAKFFEDNRKDILAMAKEDYSEFGYGSIDEMCKDWKCMKGIDSVMMVLLDGESHEDYTQVADGFAWYALEMVGRWLEDSYEETEEEDEDE
jgi:hypothetical protein